MPPKNAGTSEKDRALLSEIASRETVIFHLAPYFRIQKTGEECTEILKTHDLKPVFDPAFITPEIQELLWEEAKADNSGWFTFPPRRLVLGHTTEEIHVPADRCYYFRQYFINQVTGETLPLTTNLSAPLIKSWAKGPQTYEILNKSPKPLVLRVADLICIADVLILSERSHRPEKGNFSTQEVGKIRLGNHDHDPDMVKIREAIVTKTQ